MPDSTPAANSKREREEPAVPLVSSPEELAAYLGMGGQYALAIGDKIYDQRPELALIAGSLGWNEGNTAAPSDRAQKGAALVFPALSKMGVFNVPKLSDNHKLLLGAGILLGPALLVTVQLGIAAVMRKRALRAEQAEAPAAPLPTPSTTTTATAPAAAPASETLQ